MQQNQHELTEEKANQSTGGNDAGAHAGTGAGSLKGGSLAARWLPVWTKEESTPTILVNDAPDRVEFLRPHHGFQIMTSLVTKPTSSSSSTSISQSAPRATSAHLTSMLREVVDALGLIRLSSSAHFSVKTRVQKLEGGGGGHLQDASAKFDLALRVLEEVGGSKAVEERDQDGQVRI